MTKADIRKQISMLRPNFQALEKKSASIVGKFQGLELFQQAKTVGAYMPLPDEVDVRPLFQGSEKVFYIPTFDEAIGSYRLAEYSAGLKKGKFGILEPKNPVFAPGELDLILVPGVAFDRAGHRVGRGGGFYDRLLPQYNAVKAGVCFEFQCLEKTPSEPHDINVDLLVTEAQILKYTTNS